jgi:hypothetical protein
MGAGVADPPESGATAGGSTPPALRTVVVVSRDPICAASTTQTVAMATAATISTTQRDLMHSKARSILAKT